LPGSQAGARPFLLQKSHLEKNNAAAATGCGEEPMRRAVEKRLLLSTFTGLAG
jgi:hypothetical protein